MKTMSGEFCNRPFLLKHLLAVGAACLVGLAFGATTGSNNGHNGVQLWAGGPYFATTNLGAEKDTDVGYYYQWGGTVGYAHSTSGWKDQNGKTAGGTWYNGSASAQLEGSGTSAVLKPASDAAHALWGGNWRMMKASERDKLKSECTLTWTVKNGVQGMLFTGKGSYSGNSIFLPDGGWSGAPSPQGCAYYFTGSVAQNNDGSKCAAFYFGKTYMTTADVHRSGKAYPVRAVCDSMTGASTEDDSGGGTAGSTISPSKDTTGAKDASAIQSALDAAKSSKGTVTLGEGTFYLNKALSVEGGATLSGQGWDKTTIKQVSKDRVMTIKDGSTVMNVTITGGNYNPGGNYKYGGGVLVEKGTISWCTIKGNALTCGNTGYGGGVAFTGSGKIDHSIVTGNSVTTVSEYINGGGGIGVYQVNGDVTIDTCLVTKNVVAMSTGHKSGRGGGIGASCSAGTGLTILNTTIVGNTAGAEGGDNSSKAGAVYTEGDSGKKLKMLNCILANNKTFGTASNVVLSYAGGVTYCLFDQAADNPKGTGCKIGDPKFSNAASGIYTLSSSSPAVGAGFKYSGIDKDLSGAQFRDTPSMGCYELGSSADDVPTGEGGDEGTETGGGTTTGGGHEGVQLWAGGPYWATINCGATKVGQTGSYYYNWDDKIGYSVEGGKLTGKLVKNSGVTFWTGGWRKPTQQEAADMGRYCKTGGTQSFDGQLCVKICGNTPGYTDKYVWFPLAGWGNGGSVSAANNWGKGGKYWVEGSGGAILQHLMLYADSISTAAGGANHGNYYTLRLVSDSATPTPTPTHTHTWGTPTYEWTQTERGYTCTATAICTQDSSHKTTKTVTATYQVVTVATTETTGLGRYTATFSAAPFTTQTKEVVIPRIHTHEYGAPTYEWSGVASCRATAVCSVCDGTLVENAKITSVVTRPATCTTDGEMTYTATFKTLGTDTKTETIPAGHDWIITYEWSEDSSNCTASAVCKRDTTHTETETVKATLVVVLKPTTRKMGCGHFVATFTKEPFTTQTGADMELPAKGLPDVNYEYVQLWKEGPYWAKCNLGATSESESGYFFMWADTTGYMQEDGVWVGMNDEDQEVEDEEPEEADEKDEDESFNPFGMDLTPAKNMTLIQLKSAGIVDATGALTKRYDAASLNMGGDWRLPTKEECEALAEYCTATSTTVGDVAGLEVRGKGDFEGAAIFLPLTGCADNANMDGKTFYLTSTQAGKINQYAALQIGIPLDVENTFRGNGYQVRAVSSSKPGEGPNAHVHNWGTPTYLWTPTETGYDCTATASCTIRSSHKTNETVTATYEIVKPATCTTAGTATYTAVFPTLGTARKTGELPAGHDWAITYTWSAGYSNCTATAVCRRDATHAKMEKVKSVFVITRQPTTGVTGLGHFAATFVNRIFSDQRSGDFEFSVGSDPVTPPVSEQIKFVGFTLENGKIFVDVTTDRSVSIGQVFALVCKKSLAETATFTINATLMYADGDAGILEAVTDLPQMFVIGVGPEVK